MKKAFTKVLSSVLALLIMLSIFTVFPVTASAETNENFEYWISDEGTVEISGYTGSETELTIPSRIAGRTVTSILDYAFEYCDNLISVTIPESVINLDAWTFADCSSLENIYISENNKFFADVDGVLFNKDITEIIKYPEGKKKAQYIIPNGVISIGDIAFSNCVSLTSVTIPDGVTSIGYSAFSDCLNLSDITIPDSVTSVDSIAFNNTVWYNNQPDGIVYIGNVVYGYKGELPETSVSLKEGTISIGESAFLYCQELTSIIIPNSVTSIGSMAFNGCTNLESVIIGNGVTTIDAYAFINCTSLKNILIPDSVTNIGGSMFSGSSVFTFCTSLENIYVSENNSFFTDVNGVLFNKDVTEVIKYPEGKKETQYDIPNSVITIGYGAFAHCEGITSVTIPDSAISINSNAFYDCISLASVTIPDSVTNIGSYAFSECSSLTSVAMGNGVKSIGSGAFCLCSNLENITISDSVESFGYYVFDDTAWYDNQPDGVVYIGNIVYEYKGRMPRNTSITLKDGTKLIANYAFSNCETLSEITIPNSVISIGESAFYYCTRLTNVTIPNGVVSIGEGAFLNCMNLTSVSIPATVKEIGWYAFGYNIDEIFWDNEKIEGFTINGYIGTAAEAYAKENGFAFIKKEKIIGDANFDGDLNVKDATQIQLYLANLIGENEIDLSVCDIDNDNDVSVKDATYIQMQLAGLL